MEAEAVTATQGGTELSRARLIRVLTRIAPLLLVILVFSTFQHAPSGDLSGDGYLLSVKQERVQEATFRNVKLIVSQNYWYPLLDSNLYRPVTTLSYLLNYSVLGNTERPLGYHIFNLTIHLACVLLGYLVLLELFGERLIAFFGAAIFAVHPVNVEAVTNIAGRADLIATFGLLSALWLHIRLDRWSGWRRWGAILGILFASLVAVFAKESGMIVALVLLLYGWCGRSRPWKEVRVSYAAAAAATFLAAAARAYLAPGWHSPQQFFLNNPLLGASFWAARRTAATMLWRQFGLLFWPEKLSWDHSYNQIPPAGALMGCLAMAGLAAVAFIGLRLKRRYAPVGFLVLLALASLIPSSNLFLLINTAAADRFLYLASLAFGACLAATLGSVCRKVMRRHGAFAAAVLLTAATVAFALRTYERDYEFADNSRLTMADLESAPNSYWIQLNAAVKLYEDSQDMYSLDRAIARIQKSIDIINRLPDAESAPSPFAMKAVFLTKKAEHTDSALEQAAINGQIVALFDRAKAIDRAYRDELVARDLRRGWPRERIPLKGVSMVYENSVRAFLSMNRPVDAQKDAATWLLIEPMKQKPHEAISAIYERLGRTGDAIVEMMEAAETSGGKLAEPLLPALFRQLAPGNCSVTESGGLNESCAMVVEYFCKAHLELMDLLIRSGRSDEAAELGRSARPCPMEAGSS